MPKPLVDAEFRRGRRKLAVSLALVALMASCLTAAPSQPWFGVAMIPLVWAAVVPHVFRPVVPRGAFYIALTVPVLALAGGSALGETLHDNRASLGIVVAIGLCAGLTVLAGVLGVLRYVDIQFANAPTLVRDVDQLVGDVVSCLIPFDLVSHEVLARMTGLSLAELNITLHGLDNEGLVRRIGTVLTAPDSRSLALTRHGRATLMRQ